jgi:hypothetical protein
VEAEVRMDFGFWISDFGFQAGMNHEDTKITKDTKERKDREQRSGLAMASSAVIVSLFVTFVIFVSSWFVPSILRSGGGV